MLLFASLISLLLTTMPAMAENPYEENVQFLIKGDLTGFVDAIEAEKDFDWQKNKINLNQKNSELYAMALIVLGDIYKAKSFIDNAIARHDDSQKLKDARKHLDFMEQGYESPELNYSEEELAHIEILELFPELLEMQEVKTNLEQDLAAIDAETVEEYMNAEKEISTRLKRLEASIPATVSKLKELIAKTTNQAPYFPTRFEYLMEMDDNATAKKEAVQVIKAHRDILFPKTLEIYELASAYRTLAITTYRDGLKAYEEQKDNATEALSSFSTKKIQAEKYFRLALTSIAKLKTIWLEEDLRVGKKLPKRKTEFGYVLPQWVLSARKQFEDEYQLLVSEISPE